MLALTLSEWKPFKANPIGKTMKLAQMVFNEEKTLFFNSQGVDVKFFTYARDSGAKYLLEADWSFHNITHADWLIQMIN